jgi:hypothetical protein
MNGSATLTMKKSRKVMKVPDVFPVGGPHFLDYLAARCRIGLVPAVEVARNDVVHSNSFRALTDLSDGIHLAGPWPAVSITPEVMRRHYLGGNRPARQAQLPSA